MAGNGSYKIEPPGEPGNGDPAGEDEMASTQFSAPATGQSPVSVLGWGLALASGTAIWVLIYLLLKA